MSKNDDTHGPGHNSIDPSAAARLKSFVARVEKLNDERDMLTQDIKEVYAEAKNAGYDAKIIKKIVAERAKDLAKLKEEKALLDTYKAALQMELF